MATVKYLSVHSPFQAHQIFPTRNGVRQISSKKATTLSNVKKANLSAKKRERVKLPNYGDGDENGSYHISEFLSHSSGIEAMLNVRALQSCQSLDGPHLYRCKLPQVQLLNFEVAPVVDLQVTPTSRDCVVEMLSCKFEGSDNVESQNQHFTASMRNRIQWETIGSESFLDMVVKLDLVLEIYTQPFVLLPTSTVEGPGNLMIQALVDKLVPFMLQQLLQEYENWVHQQRQLLLRL